MNFNDLLDRKKIDPSQVIVLRHRPPEPELGKVLPWLAADRPEIFNAYQQTQGAKLEKAMKDIPSPGYVASFIGNEPGQALFVGLYSIGASKPISQEEYWQIPAYIEMKAFGMEGFTEKEGRPSVLWFDLALTDFYAQWKGKLIVGWPPPERSWWRRAHRNDIPVLAVLEESALDKKMPEWKEIILSWEQLRFLPNRLKSVLREWRGIYYIFDVSDGKGYVGAAYGDGNLLGRWTDYASTGHGDNRLLRHRVPQNFQFSILQRVSPDMEPKDVIELEGTWKKRLHTRQPYGLNDN